MRIYSDVAIDDFSLSPECFGLNIPIEYLHGYNYWDPRIGINKQSHKDFSLKNGKKSLEVLSKFLSKKKQFFPRNRDDSVRSKGNSRTNSSRLCQILQWNTNR